MDYIINPVYYIRCSKKKSIIFEIEWKNNFFLLHLIYKKIMQCYGNYVSP